MLQIARRDRTQNFSNRKYENTKLDEASQKKRLQGIEMVKRYYTLYDRLLNYQVLEEAFRKVKKANGAPGIDGQTVVDFELNQKENITKLLKELKEKSYQPLPVREVEIPKSGGSKIRKLGIPSVKCRIVQKALLEILEPIFEPEFHPSSYAYRSNRSQHQAIAKAALYIRTYEMREVVSLDISKCFDTLSHELILQRFRRRIADGSILNLLQMFLKSGVMKDDSWRATPEGCPQGGVISCLIANAYLDMFDQFMKERGHRIVRFADDIQIFKHSKKAAENALKQAKRFLEKDLQLKINMEKSHITDSNKGINFLGITIYPTYTEIQNNRIKRFKEKVKKITKRNSPRSLQQIINELNPVIRGYVNYYRIANCSRKMNEIAKWIRRRLRAKQLCLWKTKKKLKRRLRQLGHHIDGEQCLRMTAWRSSNSTLAHKAIPSSYLHKQMGLFDIASVLTGIPVLLPEGIKVDMSCVRGP